jgi:hypothetical protein
MVSRYQADEAEAAQQNFTTPSISLSAADNLLNDLQALDAKWNPPPNPYLNDPQKWIQDTLGESTWSKQREILQSVQNNRYTTVKSCHGPGKSYTAARLVAWWLATKPDPFAVTSAPTSHQVRSILWREIRRAQNKGHLPGHISQGQVPEWKIDGELVAFGRKPADYLDPNEAAAAFQGIHALHTLVVLDEGSGIPDWLATACETLITNENSRLLVIGNPDNPISWFARTFRPASGYHQITIAAWDTPAFTGEQVPQQLLDRLTSRLWVEERQQRWGKLSPLYKSKVEAEFPQVTDDSVFTPAMIEKAIINDRSNLAQLNPDNHRNGFDVARLGSDECAVYSNRNGYVRLLAKWGKAETMQSVGNFRRLWDPDRPELAPHTNVDVVGLGAGVYDRLKELGYTASPFNAGEKALNPEKYKNRRAEAYWEAAEMMDQGLIDIEPEDEDLAAELLEHKYKHTSTGQIQLEAKEDVAARLGRSPDRADAFVMSLQRSANYEALLKRQAAPVDPTPTTNQTDTKPTEEPADLVSDLLEIQL